MRATSPAVSTALETSEISRRSRREYRSTMTPPTKRNITVGVIRAAANHANFSTLCVVSRTKSVSATRATPSPKFDTV